MSAMREDIFYDSRGTGKLHACIWQPEGTPRAIVQIVHGIAEHVLRYDEFAEFLNRNGIVVVAEDHMGHGGSCADGEVRGYFHGGWFAAVNDTVALMEIAKQRFGALPYVLFGHSMGSFMVRTILTEHPDCELAGCVICGTGWQPNAVLAAGIQVCKLICKRNGEKNPSVPLYKMIFGAYNTRVEHVRTPSDWLSRDSERVDAYEADPMCGFVPSAGLMRDMMTGIAHIQNRKNLERMSRKLPCFFIAGGDDPVGAYGKGVRQTADAFSRAGMENVKTRIYPLARHEILNEINRREVYEDILAWVDDLMVQNIVHM